MMKFFKIMMLIGVLLVMTLSLSFFTNGSKSSVLAASVTRFPWMDNKTLWPVGVNLAWYNWDQDFLDSGWTERFAAIKAQMDVMAAEGVHALRWWVFPDACNVPLFDGTGEGSLCTGLPTNWVNHMVEAADYAKAKNIRIYFCFTSFDWGYNGRAWNHDDVFDNATVRRSFLDNAVKPILQALGTHEGVLGWDVINEPEWLISSADGGDPNNSCEAFSLVAMQQFVKDVVAYVHTYAKQPVSVGSASMKWCGGQYQFWKGLGLDFYDFHWYDWATPYFNPLKTSPADLGLDKPCIIGEMMPNPGSSSLAMSHQEVLEGLYANGYSGYMPWAWNDSSNDCKPYVTPSFTNFESVHPDVNQILSGTTTAIPAFSPAGGTYSTAQSVTISCATSGATIRYTTDGNTPMSSSTVYSGPIKVSKTTTIKAYATSSGMTDSAVATATYTIGTTQQVATPTFSPAGGTYSTAQSVTISCATSGATIRYTTDGSTPTSSSTVYSGPITVSKTTTIKAYATASGMTDSAVATATYTISSSSSYLVSYSISNDWGSGAVINVTITNNSAAVLNSWTLAWTFPGSQKISNLWNGSYTQSGESVSVNNLSYNGTIVANGGTASFGFQITYSGSNAKPTNFSLNGISCQAQ